MNLVWSREKCEEEGAAERSCYRLTAGPVPHTPALLEGRRKRSPE